MVRGLVLHVIKAADLVATDHAWTRRRDRSSVLCQRHQKRRDAEVLPVLVRVALRARAQPSGHRDRVLLEHVFQWRGSNALTMCTVSSSPTSTSRKATNCNRARLGVAHVVAHAPDHPRRQVWPLEAPVRVVAVGKVDKNEPRRLGPLLVGYTPMRSRTAECAARRGTRRGCASQSQTGAAAPA